MKPILTNPSWSDIHRDTLMMLLDLSARGYAFDTFDHIVGLTRGGLIPGTILSHATGTPLTPFQYSSKMGRGDDKADNDTVIPAHICHTSVLIVDDIADSGQTLQELEQLFVAAGCAVYSACLYTKLDSVAWPTVHVHTLPADSPWIIFPWENQG